MKRFLVMLAMFAALLSGCRKQDAGSGGDPTSIGPAPQPGKVGTPIGSAAAATIGSAGGTLMLGDSSILVSIPAGAVAANTVFSIQRITNTAPNGIGSSYQLLPEGTHFKKPVSIIFKYAAGDIEGSTTDALAVAWQDSAQIWNVKEGSTVDSTTRRVIVSSDHFSIWSMFLKVNLTVDKPSIDKNEEASLYLRQVNIVSRGGSLQLDTATIAKKAAKWDLTGQGAITVLSGSEDHCVYTAPPVEPRPNPVTVFAIVDNAIQGSNQKIKLSRKIYVSDTYFELTLNDNTNIYPSAMVDATGNVWTLVSQNSKGNGVIFCFPGSGGIGSYQWGTRSLAGGDFQLAVGGVQFTDVYIDCHNDIQYQTGTVSVNQWGGVEHYVTGTFSGSVVTREANSCAVTVSTIKGRFKAIRIS